MDISSKKYLPRNLYRTDAVRRLDQLAIESFDLPGLELMRRAGASAFSILLNKWPSTRRLLVFTGGGNNAGDGYVIAGLAKREGLDVCLLSLRSIEQIEGDAAAAASWALESGVQIQTYDPGLDFSEYVQREGTIIVDAIFGIGLNRDVEGLYAQAIEEINSLAIGVLSVDIPSGLCADTGKIFTAAVRADVTVTYIGLKQGLLTGAAVDYCGELHFDDLGLPEQLLNDSRAPIPSAERIDVQQQSSSLRPRPVSAHKGSNGHVVIVGGDTAYGGAVSLAAEAALRSGSGLVSVITRSIHRPAILSRRPEIMVMGSEDEEASRQRRRELLARADAIVLGPGLGASSWSLDRLREALEVHEYSGVPIVIDADGLNLLAQASEEYGQFDDRNCVLTPHPGEAARLLACDIKGIQDDRFQAVQRLQQRWGAVCLIKGAGTLICGKDRDTDESKIFLSTEGNAAMSSAGMGDVLSGIIGSLLGQGYSSLSSTNLGVCVHGEAADQAVEQSNAASIIATDLFNFLPQLLHPR